MPGKPKDRTLPPNGIPRLTAADINRKLPKNKMFVSDAGAAAIVAKSHLVFDLVYDHTANPSAQVDAISHLARYNVHHDPDGPCPTGHWSIAWSNHKDRSSPPAIWSIKYILMVCTCGYDHTKRNSKNRTAAFPLTDCPAHLEITVHPPTGAILRVRGLAEHNAACDSAMLEHRPHQPVAAIVYRTALEPLSSVALVFLSGFIYVFILKKLEFIYGFFSLFLAPPIPPPASRLPPPASRLPPPASHLPPPTSRLPPPGLTVTPSHSHTHSGG
ncbi:hypothetical protein MIND_01168000 [Mycena indigotica]|uniref:Uncharacterized protein n=1 Tax=Mycena indigotica TaxID=2126181 RepID=A0A8H6VWH1_9AGAR|nr:uncharacterized protein MIND_01168000 [Mycena indigotica]KAF7292698.1 hypothetical protein MIND_01168000 [Mycena indigotica]